MRATTRAWAFCVVSPLVLVGALWTVRAATAPGPSGHWDDSLRRDVQTIVETRYVDPIDEEASRRLFHAALEGYVGRLDAFSRFVPPEDRPDLDRETQGRFGGVGVRVTAERAGLRVGAVRIGGPADVAGVQPGDLIEAADGAALAGRDADRMHERLRGEPASTVTLRVRRGAETLEIPVVRREVPLDTVPAVRYLAGDVPVGYVRIEQFTDATTADVREAFAKLRDDGVRALVLDLRHNLGGVVRSAVDVASLLLPPGSVVCVARRRQGGTVEKTAAPQGFEPLTIPLAVLTDESTASASEILAGALQDHGRAVLVGERTWGKFLVQSLVDVDDGRAVVKLTTARYETPRGRSAPRDASNGPAGGLAPDVRVPLRTDAAREALRVAFARQVGPHWRRAEGATDPATGDPVLDAAVSLLRGAPPPAEPVPVRAM